MTSYQGNDKDRTHNTFLDQKVPLSERNQGETDSASASVKNQKQVSIFFDFQSQHIASKEDMIKFFEDQQEKKRKANDLSAKIKHSQEVNALLDKDYNTRSSPRKRQVEALKTEPIGASHLTQSVSTLAPVSTIKPVHVEGGQTSKEKTAGPAKPNPQGDNKAARGASLTSTSTAVGKSAASTAKPGTSMFGSTRNTSISKSGLGSKQVAAARR